MPRPPSPLPGSKDPPVPGGGRHTALPWALPMAPRPSSSHARSATAPSTVRFHPGRMPPRGPVPGAEQRLVQPGLRPAQAGSVPGQLSGWGWVSGDGP